MIDYPDRESVIRTLLEDIYRFLKPLEPLDNFDYDEKHELQLRVWAYLDNKDE